MAYDEKTAARVRRALAGRLHVEEKPMFGGLCFMVNGAMCCGLAGDSFMVRVGLEAYAEALAQPHARPMDFTGRPLKGMVYVDPPGYATAGELAKWVRRGLDFVASEPARAKRKKPRARPRIRRPPRGSG